MGKNTVEGLRLRNPRFFCFLNTAINTVVTNEVLVNQLMKDDTSLKAWGEQMLLVHDPNFVDGTEKSYRDLLKSLDLLSLDSTGCSKSHGEVCFESVKTQIKPHILKSKLLGN